VLPRSSSSTEPPYGIAPIKGGKEYAKELGFEVLGDENVDLKAIEANSQLLSVKNKGADFAWIGGRRTRPPSSSRMRRSSA